MKTSRIIKLLASLTVAVSLCSCGGGGGGGGGGGTSDKGWSYHPGSTDPKTESDEPDKPLKGRRLVLENGETTLTFRFEYDGTCTVTQTGRTATTGTMDFYTYKPDSAKQASATFRINNAKEEWEGDGPGSITLKITFAFHDAFTAFCTITDEDKGKVTSAEADFFMIPAPETK